VLDASSIIALGKVGFLDRFCELCEVQSWTVVITEQVLKEIGESARGTKLEKYCQPCNVSIDATLRQAHDSLGEGELSVLTAASSFPGMVETVAILDDLVARKAAMMLGLTVWGTLRVLKIALDTGHITLTEWTKLIERMRATGFRFDDKVLRELVGST
jgi:predicted nucleic acid-binding protein